MIADVSSYGVLYSVLGCLFGFLMTWGVGANDLANIMSTTMGSKAVSVRQAIFIVVVFEIAGAFLGGSGVTNTMRNGIINIHALNTQPLILVDGMLSVLLAGMIWMAFASFMGMPVSITNAIVGSVIGFGVIVLGVHAIHWHTVGMIAISWISSPLLAGIFAFILCTTIQNSIMAKRDPVAAAKKYMPVYLFLIGVVLSFITVLKGLKHFGVALNVTKDIFITLGSGSLVLVLGWWAIHHYFGEFTGTKRRERFNHVEKMFSVLMGLTACAMVFAHGSNDVSIAVGPMTVILSVFQHGGHLNLTGGYPAWIVLLGCVGVITGLFMYGRKVIETVGQGITTLTPSRAFAATLAAATAVVISTSTGIPVSATQTLVGGVLGVGLARGIGALDLVVIRNIFMSWIITIPAASVLTIGFYHLFRLLH